MASYSKELKEQILRRVRNGESVRRISEEVEPSYETIRKWVQKDTETMPSPERMTVNYVQYRLDDIDTTTPDGKAEYEKFVMKWQGWWDRRARIEVAKLKAEAAANNAAGQTPMIQFKVIETDKE